MMFFTYIQYLCALMYLSNDVSVNYLHTLAFSFKYSFSCYQIFIISIRIEKKDMKKSEITKCKIKCSYLANKICLQNQNNLI